MKPFLKLSILVTLIFLCISCGRKAPPRLPTHEPPPAPAGLKVVQRYHPRQVVLTWTYGDAGRTFVIERASGDEIARIATVTERHFIDDGLDETLTYRYLVRALNREGEMSEAAISGEISPVPNLEKPVNVSIDVSGDTVKFTWDYPGDKSGSKFNIYRRKEDVEYSLSPANGDPVRGNVFEDKQNLENTVYYSVRLVILDDVSTEGPPSSEVKVSPEDYVPRPVTGLGFAVTTEKVLVFWNENPEPWVRGYRVYRAGEDGSFRAIGTSRTPAFEDGEPLLGKSSYRVSALGPVREGLPSEIIVVQPAAQP